MDSDRQKTFFKLLVLGICFLIFGSVLNTYAATEFWLSNLEKVQFDSRQHEVMVMSFFFVGCQPCYKEIPLLYQWMSEHYPTVPLLFIDSWEEDSEAQIKNFIGALGVPHKYFYHDVLGKVGHKFFGKDFVAPTIFVIREHQVVFKAHELNEDNFIKIKKFLPN